MDLELVIIIKFLIILMIKNQLVLYTKLISLRKLKWFLQVIIIVCLLIFRTSSGFVEVILKINLVWVVLKLI